MSKNIVNGKLVETSPSMIVAFDANTTFGCERRGFYKYVMGLSDPPSGNQELGTALHALIEERLKTGKTPVVEHEAAGLYLSGQAMIEEVARRKILAVETPLKEFKVADVKLKGFVDVVHETGIIDWKTSSDIRRYGKTAADLAKDTQMVLYGKAEHADKPFVKLAHGYFQTKGRKSTEFVEVEVSQDHLDRHIDKVIVPLVERIKVVAGFTDAREATPDFKKCFNCAFKTRCPQPGAESVMSFFQNLNKKSTTASITEPPRTEVAQVKPPDAPPSDPSKAAEPVEGFSPISPPKKERKLLIEDVGDDKTAADYSKALKEEIDRAVQREKDQKSVGDVVKEVAAELDQKEKRGRGRPAGSKNKPKTNEEKITYPPGSLAEAAAKEQASASRSFESITVSLGATINVGNFNSVRFDVSVTSKEHTYEEIYEEVKRRLDAEAAKYESEMDKNNKVNALKVVSK